MGMTRRMQHYDNAAWQPWLLLAAVVLPLGVRRPFQRNQAVAVGATLRKCRQDMRKSCFVLPLN
jgi:hypothetical protein